MVADGDHVAAVQDLTGGGAVVFDFVAEQGAEMDAWTMTAAGGSFRHRLRRRAALPTLDFVAGEKNIVGNIVGTYADLAELMVLAQAGKVTLHTRQYPGPGRRRPARPGSPERSGVGRSSCPEAVPRVFSATDTRGFPHVREER